MATFNNQFQGDNYGQINQAGRDIAITHIGDSVLDALQATAVLRAALGRAGLSARDEQAARHELEEVERELRQHDPDRQKIARRLERLTETLKVAGGLAAAGAALVGPIGVIAGFLGPAGQAVVKLLR